MKYTSGLGVWSPAPESGVKYNYKHFPSMVKLFAQYDNDSNDEMGILKRDWTIKDWIRILEYNNVFTDEVRKELLPYVLGETIKE